MHDLAFASEISPNILRFCKFVPCIGVVSHLQRLVVQEFSQHLSSEGPTRSWQRKRSKSLFLLFVHRGPVRSLALEYELSVSGMDVYHEASKLYTNKVQLSCRYLPNTLGLSGNVLPVFEGKAEIVMSI